MTALLQPLTAPRRPTLAHRSLRDWLIGRDEVAANLRLLLVVIYIGVVWLGAILVERPAVDLGPLGEQTNLLALLLKPFVIVALAAIKLQVLRHLALPLITLWLGVRDGARYVDDLFELHDRALARDFLLAALFGLGYPVLEIKDGQVSDAGKKTSLYRIGGPGYLKVYLGNAALFERVGGKSKIYPSPPRRGAPTAAGLQFVQSFDRLREVIDLRPQFRRPENMEVYTKDGILVKARDLEVMFRMWADDNAAPSEPVGRAYAFTEQAVRRAVFGKTVGRDSAPAPWQESVARASAGLVVDEIGKLRLQDLIAQKQKVGAIRPIAPEAIDTGQALASPAVNADEADNPRRTLALSVLKEENIKRFAGTGVRLGWLGIGTLETPPEVTLEFINAWTTDRAARQKVGQINFESRRAAGRSAQIAEVVHHITNYWLREQMYSDKGTTTTDVLRMYHIKLVELFKITRAMAWPPKTEEALDYINQLSRPITIGGE